MLEGMSNPRPLRLRRNLLISLAIVAAGVGLGLLYADWRARQLAELTSEALRAGTSVLPADRH